MSIALKKYMITITLSVIAVLLFLVTTNLSFGKDKWMGILESDAKGYYAYLPAVFIYHDLNFGFFEHIEKEKYYQEHIFYDYRSGANGFSTNKYYAGAALAQLPFFLVAHAATLLTNGDADGYSKLYMFSVPIAALFYHVLGLWFLAGLLRLYKVRETIISLLLLATAFGTHLFVYTVVEGGMSHVFSFAFISGFLYYSKRYFDQQQLADVYKMALLLGLIILCRPINGLVGLFLIPLAGNLETLKNGLLDIFCNLKAWLVGLILFVGIVGIQLVIYKISTGSFFVYSYVDEGFNFTDPHFFDILFSYKKGLFLYTPMLLLGLISTRFLVRTKSFFSISWLLFFVGITYVFSSWWMWFYGGSFSSRVYVEYIPIFMLPLGLFLESCAPKVKKVTIGLIICLIGICQIQSYQYRYYEIHYTDMDQAKYWEVFLMRNHF
jgi:hypothetical protein